MAGTDFKRADDAGNSAGGRAAVPKGMGRGSAVAAGRAYSGNGGDSFFCRSAGGADELSGLAHCQADDAGENLCQAP